MEKGLRGKKFKSDEEVKVAVSTYFSGKDKKRTYEGIHYLIERSKKNIWVAGDYIEKRK